MLVANKKVLDTGKVHRSVVTTLHQSQMRVVRLSLGIQKFRMPKTASSIEILEFRDSQHYVITAALNFDVWDTKLAKTLILGFERAQAVAEQMVHEETVVHVQYVSECQFPLRLRMVRNSKNLWLILEKPTHIFNICENYVFAHFLAEFR